MRILILNWRDIKNPKAGGAEVVTHEIAKRWVQWGHEVTLFTAGFPGAIPEEEFEGVRIIRRGEQYSVHYEAFRYYRRYLEGRLDVVIDEINTIPFLTPLYVKEKKVAFFHQLAREVWLYESKFPMNVIGYVSEPLYLKVYRNIPTVVVSESTRQDLLRLGFRRVHVVHDGIDVTPLAEVPPPVEKANEPTVLYVGRVVPSKRVTDIVEAVGLVRKDVPNVRLWVVGDGKAHYMANLRHQVERYKLDGHLRFWGKVSLEKKLELMKQAHVLALASVREGWGLVVIEANAMGTPAVVYNVHGLRDSVHHGETGLICAENRPRALAQALVSLLKDESQRTRLAQSALQWSRKFTWDRTADEFLAISKMAAGDT
ncbi:hypothetical protein HKBW3S44_00767 [Candidatus Hakubella thermalkaliphila]|uniref:Glycosyltransferase family 1 protein n=1 Tax=Candidatus Hakubella thermalkaliphila TaxID=2754717 RepID=A0A6V8PGE1_9ACTN|nr:glycosyltransferase family 4 protein [Candidatus Hakubella thermalkaliphila]MBT9167033.1 D-inositol 3-phosphate glycosyltransferase [Bacillota bacterium]GFP29956.1 hypothetical protein HKBW3S34_00876 [Candidatus Hakubella thermalkaliphila]GFP37087.1 hypothetical protein HKBW3S44_00767 [Candidatus Hakubella thermalkaliphila]GFP38696.1 hypothetical protein HKBW3S47_00397 [Candidatus Hakubella thermalkaliphila]GFP43477.1 hypothetical protein HKBW3C_02607 [Candidatus Hakubella thermalkaliphila]